MKITFLAFLGLALALASCSGPEPEVELAPEVAPEGKISVPTVEVGATPKGEGGDISVPTLEVGGTPKGE